MAGPLKPGPEAVLCRSYARPPNISLDRTPANFAERGGGGGRIWEGGCKAASRMLPFPFDLVRDMEDRMGEDDRLALVTGTSSGLGIAIAKVLLENGWTVVGISRRNVELGHPHYEHIQLDLADTQRLDEISRIRLAPTLRDSRWQRVGLVNNAGVAAAMLPLESIDLGSLARSFAVNAAAPIYLMGLVVRETSLDTQLRIVNLSTGAAVQPFPGLADYGSSKAALRQASLMFAAELASTERAGGPRLNASIMSYSPGTVDTPMQETARSADHAWFKLFRDIHSQGLLVAADEPAAEVVEFLGGESHDPFVEKRFGTP